MGKHSKYEITFKIEVLNEFANGVYARLLNFVLNNGIDRKDKNNFYNVLLDQFAEILDLNLFKMSFEELEVLEGYWRSMNSYIKEITKGKLVYQLDVAYFSEDQFQDRFQELKYRLSIKKSIQKNPVAYILGGQPGAGKSLLHGLIKDKLSDNVITIDNDTFKQMHPNFDLLVEKYGKDYVAYVTPFSNRMTEALMNHFSNQGFSLTIEGTLRTVETPVKTVTNLKEKGYEVNLYVMAVSKDLSYLGTLARYESMYARSSQTARATDKAIHDTVVSNLPDNLDTLCSGDYFADISLFTREETKVYSSVETPSISQKQVIYEALHQELPKDVLINRIDHIIHLAKQNNHQISDLLNWRKELTQ
ncbi:zeta toxin family protein [Microbacteriaceae bacterium 4G12]